MEPATNGICTYLHTLSRLVALPVARFQPDRALHVDRDADGVTLTLAGGETIHGALLVAAEGRNSPTREVEGIRTTRWNYRHVAMVTAIDHEEIGRAHVGTPVTKAHLVCRLLLEKKKNTQKKP